jgi:predicted dehydrogenase
MWRHTPQADRIIELLPRLGELINIRATFSHRLGDDTDIRVDRELEGGSLMDVGCYCVSGARLIAGEEPEAVFGQQVATADGVDRRFVAMMRFPSGVVATFDSGFDSHSESLEVTGRAGSMSLPDPWHSIQGLILLDGEEDRVEPTNPYACELDDMAAAIRGEKAPRLGRADAMGQARTIEALYHSASEGAPVSLA